MSGPRRPVEGESEVEVRAAGGVVWSPGPDGRLRIAVVHRPRYDDWSLPKGKAHEGEDDLACALREVEEETGMRCLPGQELATARYYDRLGRHKQVRYWAMEARGGSFSPDREVDQIRWETPEDATALLTYPHDVEVVAGFRAGGLSRTDP